MGRLGSRATCARMIAGAVTLAAALIATPRVRAEQQPPPIHGVTGTVATEESARDTKEAGRGIFSRVARILGLSRRPADTSNAAAEEAFNALEAGTRVTVSVEAAPDKPDPPETEAVIMDVNRTEHTIVIRLEDGSRQSLRLSDGTSRAGDRGTVVVFVKNAAGERTTHYFKRIG
jgi:hypothetical protein